jgi:hypothetical protein
MMEALVAIVMLAVIGFALHQATLSALGYMQTGKARAAQARLLEHAIDRARAEVCLIKSLSPGSVTPFELYDGSTAYVRPLVTGPGEPPSVRLVEVELLSGAYAPGVKQTLLLDAGPCE